MKFQKGEIAILIAESTSPNAPKGVKGREVEILEVGPFPAGYIYAGNDSISERADYIMSLDGDWWGIDEQYLRKRYPPGSEIARTIMAKTPRGVEA